MASLASWRLLILLVLAALLASASAEYTWNGSEWVWTEKEATDQGVHDPQGVGLQDLEGSGDGGDFDRGGSNSNSYAYPDGEDTWDDDDNDYDEGSGGDGGNDEDYNSDPNQNPNVDNRQNPGGGMSNSNTNTYYSTEKPRSYNPGEVEETGDIFVDGGPSFPTTTKAPTTTTQASQRDPSISSRPKNNSRSTSFFAQPGTLAAVIGGAVVGLLCAILCVMFVVYRMRKKDEGSYALDEPKRSPTVNSYSKQDRKSVV